MQVFQKIIINLSKSRVKTPADLASFKRKISKKYKISCPSNIELLKEYHKSVRIGSIKKSEILKNLLKTRPIRSLSGIVNISVLTKPYSCPGKCLYCPTEKGIPKSYLSGEPAVERAKQLKYDPYWQTRKRIEMLEIEGHPTDKIELRIVGETWSHYPKKYQEWFITRCFTACNDKNSKCKNQNVKLQLKIKNLRNAQRRNETAKHRIVGLSIETRPDFINEKEIRRLRYLGVTMVELGVQSIYDNVLKLNKRGHGIKETILATRILKDAGFKVLYQMMPNLPGSSLKGDETKFHLPPRTASRHLARDEKMFEELFQNPDFQPDLLKIYPCALLKEAPLYKIWKKGGYRPYTKNQLLNLVKSIKKKIPYYVRIQRISRDIPSQKIVEGGAKISNLRQLLTEEIKTERWQCKCIRCREIRGGYDPKEKIYLFRQNYQSSGGKEIFLTFENKDRTKLYSLLRLRIPPTCQSAENCSPLIFPVLKDGAIIREIHTYGELVSIGKTKVAPQHQGLGKKLIKEAEKISKKEFKLKRIAVISSVGVRKYWRQLKYRLKDTYMIKEI